MPLRILDKIPFLRGRLDSHMREVVGGATIAFVLKIIGAALTFVFNILLARFLGAEGAGLYFLVLMVVSIASIIGLAGLDNTLLRFIASHAALDDWSLIKGAYKKGISLVLASSIFSTVVIYAAAPWIANFVFAKPELLWPIRLMSLSIVPCSLLTIYGEMLKGLRRIFFASVVQSIGVQALSVAGIYLLGRYMGVEGAMWAYIAATVITCFTGFWFWRIAAHRIRGIKGDITTRELLRSSTPLFWVSVTNLVINMAPSFILGICGTKADMGIFGVASRTAMLISFLLMAANSIVAPKFATLYRLGEMEALGKMARGSASLLAILAAPILLFILLFPSVVMGIFGDEFRHGGTVLSILAVGQFVNVATGSVGYLLMMSGNEKLLRNNIAAIAVMNIILDLVLIPRFGVIGASISVAMSMVIMNLISSALVKSSLGILVLPFPLRWQNERK